MSRYNISWFSILTIVFVLVVGHSTPVYSDDSKAMAKRSISLQFAGKWIGNGISYSAYRDGEGPDRSSLTSKENILQDLQLIVGKWKLIRLYGAGRQSERILEVIQDNHLPVKVMQGAWISGHQSKQENDTQVDGLIDLANRFPEIIVAVNVGNEIFVDWSWHKISDINSVIGYIRKVRDEIKQPVTVCDDYNFWNKPRSIKIAREIDFIGLHAYAFWNNKTIDDAMSWTESIYRDIQNRHPGYQIAYTETGWPSSRIFNDSYEGRLIGSANENNQKLFFEQYNAWVNENRVVSFYFEAFDEKWKGGMEGENPMDKAEKHWGVYYSDRTPKILLQ